jgi:uncharacterized protein YjbJ (UPF0337 family)
LLKDVVEGTQGECDRAQTQTSQGGHMNWDQIEGKWKQFSGAAREKWGKLTDSDWQVVAGKKDQLVGRIQQRYGVAREEADRQADEWARTLDTMQPTR